MGWSFCPLLISCFIMVNPVPSPRVAVLQVTLGFNNFSDFILPLMCSKRPKCFMQNQFNSFGAGMRLSSPCLLRGQFFLFSDLCLFSLCLQPRNMDLEIKELVNILLCGQESYHVFLFQLIIFLLLSQRGVHETT